MSDLDNMDVETIAEDIDTMILDLCLKHKMDPFLMSGVILARLSLCAEAGQYIEDYKELLEAVKERCNGSHDVIHPNAYH